MVIQFRYERVIVLVHRAVMLPSLVIGLVLPSSHTVTLSPPDVSLTRYENT